MKNLKNKAYQTEKKNTRSDKVAGLEEFTGRRINLLKGGHLSLRDLVYLIPADEKLKWIFRQNAT